VKRIIDAQIGLEIKHRYPCFIAE